GSCHPGPVRTSTSRRPSRWHAVAVGLIVLSTSWFVVGSRHGLVGGLSAFASLGPGVVALALAVVALGIATRGVLAFVASRIVGVPTRLAPMVRLSAASYAAHKVTKSGGLAGLVPYVGDAHRRGHGVGPVLGAYVCMQAAGLEAMGALTTVALVAGWWTG